MIVANSTWGGLLASKGVPAIYRAQTAGKVRMTTAPQAHEGLGVAQYAWSSSPLRRYVDLLNQWQLVACLTGEMPPFKPRSELLFAALRDFDLTYAAYAEFQRGKHRIGVGQRDGGHARVLGQADQFLDRNRPFQQRMLGMGAQVDESWLIFWHEPEAMSCCPKAQLPARQESV